MLAGSSQCRAAVSTNKTSPQKYCWLPSNNSTGGRDSPGLHKQQWFGWWKG